MNVTRLTVPEVQLIEPKVHMDARGYFMEAWHSRRFAEAGLDVTFVQDNQSGSVRGTLRGLHYQISKPQGKLVRVVSGEIFDVAVDLRRGSPTFGKWAGAWLSADNKLQLFVPAGFAHGFLVVSEYAEVAYKCTDYYSPEQERTLLWNDPEIGVSWPVGADEVPILSAKDRAGKRLVDCEVYP